METVEKLGDHIVDYLVDTEEVNALQAAAGLKFSNNLYPLAEEILRWLKIDDLQGQIIELTAQADPELLVKFEELQGTLKEREKQLAETKTELQTLQDSFDDLLAAHRKLLG